MKIFIDGEWDGFKGQLLSFALVAQNGASFYEVLANNSNNDWILANVIHKLEKDPISLEDFTAKLEAFLMSFDEAIHIVADWPEDIERLCALIVTGAGTRIDTPPLTMEIIRIDTVSKNPHNALADATALKDWYLNIISLKNG